MSGNFLVVNADGPETRIALVESGQVAELFIERKRDQGIVGSVYKGRVARVLPGMGAAFVDIGIDKAAFLYVADVAGGAAPPGTGDRDGDLSGPIPTSRHGKRIEELLRQGQEVLVQVVKEPMGTKGARVTTQVSLPGRHLVFMPLVDHVGISRRITGESERERLRAIVEAHRPPGTGFILRTAAEGASSEDLAGDASFLVKLWEDIGRRGQGLRAPAVVYRDLDLVLRTVRDAFTSTVDRLVVDDTKEHDRVLEFVTRFMPELSDRVFHYQGHDPLFDEYAVEPEINRALDRRVWLKSGGYLVIDQSEALTAIDVNTGRFVGKRDLEETITKNNLEACREVAAQLRLRNLGGLVVVDFIDMDQAENRDKVEKALQTALHPDRARSKVIAISELGLLEMTRKRTRESLRKSLSDPCSYCGGRGHVKSKLTVAYEVLRALMRRGGGSAPNLVATCHPDVAELLATSELEYVQALEERLGKTITVQPDTSFHIEQYDIAAEGRG